MPRRLLITIAPIVAIFAMTAAPQHAHAEGDKVVGAARTASVMAAIVRYCPAFFVIDGPKATKLGAAGYELAQQWAPPGRGMPILKKEAARREREVEATGARYWCQNQREVHRSLGTQLFLD